MSENTQVPSNQSEIPSLPSQPTEQKTELAIDISQFLISQRQIGRTPSTIEKYSWHLDLWTAWLTERQVGRLADLSRSLLREWGAGLYDLKCKVGPKAKTDEPDGWAPATIRQAVAVVRSFLGWCYRERLLNENLAESLVLPPVKNRIQRTLSPEEIQALLKACDLNTSKGVRDVALISLLGDSGLRSHELRRLTRADIQFGVRIGGELVNVVFVIGKDGHEEPTYFGHKTAERLQAWCEIRPEVPGVDKLFISIGGLTPGKPFTRHGLRTMLAKLGRKAGLEGVTPHALRRSFACIADEAGATTRKIQIWGRWKDIRMVEHYTRSLKAGKQYNKHSPMDYIASLDD